LKIKIDDKLTIAVILLLILLFSISFLGFTGLRVLFGIILVFFLPFYIILDNFDLSRGEKVTFSFFIGVGIFPAIAYWLGVFMSFKLAIILTFVLLCAVGIMIKKLKGFTNNQYKS
jgi:apolipoprotein N-acyltransferase